MFEFQGLKVGFPDSSVNCTVLSLLPIYVPFIIFDVAIIVYICYIIPAGKLPDGRVGYGGGWRGEWSWGMIRDD